VAPDSANHPEPPAHLHVLLTGAAGQLGSGVAAALSAAGHTIRRTDRQAESTAAPATGEFHLGDLTDPVFVRPLLDGVDAIVHLEPLGLPATMPAEAPGEILDAAARGTHVLYKAALEAGVLKAVQASTLAIMDAYGEEYEVTEQWRPRPDPVPAHLAPYLAELVGREFTRDVSLERHPTVMCLRFDHLAGGAIPPDRQLDIEDAARAIVNALTTLQTNPRQRGHRWQVLHIAPPTPEARYSSDLARRAIGYAGGPK
jgi:nucleoside-diphosphate-sugar epimerase